MEWKTKRTHGLVGHVTLGARNIDISAYVAYCWNQAFILLVLCHYVPQGCYLVNCWDLRLTYFDLIYSYNMRFQLKVWKNKILGGQSLGTHTSYKSIKSYICAHNYIEAILMRKFIFLIKHDFPGIIFSFKKTQTKPVG